MAEAIDPMQSQSEAAVRHDFIGGEGLKIAADVGGRLGAPTIILGHGGGQTRHSWSGAAARLMSAGFRVINYDLRGHGESAWSEAGSYSCSDRAMDLLAIMHAVSGPLALVGASMGGISALYAAAIAEDVDLRALILVDIVPKPDPAGVQHIRSFMRRHLDGFATIEEAADAVQSYNPNRRRPTDLSGLHKNLRLRNDKLYWHWDPAILRLDSVREHGILTAALTRRSNNILCPVLLVRGLNSDIVSDEGISELRSWFPQTEVFDVAGAGHMVAGDKNDEFHSGVIAFLNRHLSSGLPLSGATL